MQVLTLKDLSKSNAANAADLLTIMLNEGDGTIRLSLGNNEYAGFQVIETPTNLLEQGLSAYLFYDFTLNDQDKTIEMDEETTGDYELSEIEDLIEYRLNKIIDLIE